MTVDKQFYFLKLNPPRLTFGLDMTAEERSIMEQHIAYWKPFVDNGTMVVMGPVLDPKGMYGIGIVEVEHEEQLKKFIANDPANGLNQYEYYPMKAVKGR